MDNVVQNINIEDIIPSNFKPTNEEKRKIDELAVLIKQFGLLDPILVRPKNGKYEIILGMDKYQAALIANQNMVPVIVKEVDDEIYSKYSNIDTNNPVSLNTSPKETFSKKEKNSDVVNLSELSKIKLEYERDDKKMNNGQFNNDMTNNNLGQPNMNQQNQGPTFGGRFFPSLEDETTNMNMMGGLNESLNTPPVAPAISNNELNNNLIDLTDLSIEKDLSTNFGTQSLNTANPTIEPISNTNLTQMPNNNFDSSTLGVNSLPMNDNIINLDSLQNNNPTVRPVSEPVSMETLNADFGAPTSMPNQINTSMTSNLTMPSIQSFNEPQIPVQPNFDPVQPTMIPQQQPLMNNQQPMMDLNVNQNQPIQGPNEFVTPSMPFVNNMAAVDNDVVPTKDVTPVTNTIKNLVTSLESFGYKINVTEEDLPNMSKLTIEIEK